MSYQVNKIAKNSFFLYIRMFILMFIGLYTSRLILEVLGIVDLGIYNVVGSLIIMLDFVSSSLTNSAQRYLNIGLGKNDINLTNKYFCQCVGIHFILSICILLIGETIGIWFLENKLVIPIERLSAAKWVFQFSIVSVFFRINQICFQSVIIAREKMSIYAYLSIFEGISKLAIIYLLFHNILIDKLIYYSFLLLVVQIIIFFIHIVYCWIKYPESHYRLYWNNNLSKEMLSFVSINVFGSISWALGIQGVNIILNIYFGPAINAAKGLASTIERIIIQFVNNIYLAVKPQIIKSFAQNHQEEMLILCEKSSIYIFYAAFILSLPMLYETNFILNVWLKEIPEYTEVFTKLMIVQSYFWMLPIPYNQIINATGKIKRIQLYGRLFTLLSLPISYLILKFLSIPYIPVLVVIIMDIFFWLYTIFEVSRQINMDFSRYTKNVIIPIVKVSFTLIVFSSILHHFVSLYKYSFLIVFPSIWIIGSIIVFMLGISKQDYFYFKKIIKAKLNNIQ